MADGEDLKAISIVWTVNRFNSSAVVCSPCFKSRIYDTTWQLCVKTENDTISLRICRPRNFFKTFDVELSFLDFDGSVLFLKKFRIQEYKDLHERCILNWRTREPPTSLKVGCKIWKMGWSNLTIPKTVFARTEIGEKRVSFVWNIKKFSLVQPTQKTVVELKNEKDLKSLHFEMKLNTEGGVCLTLSYLHFEQISIYSTFQVSVLDSMLQVVDSKINSNEIYFPLSMNLEQVLNFPLLRQKLTSNEKHFLPGDILSLRCEVTMNGTLLHLFEDNESSTENLLETSFTSSEIDIKTMHTAHDSGGNTRIKSGVPNETLKEMFESKLFCDYTLRAESKSFPVHKAVLCSRSTVFRAMFTGHMKESRNEYADIPNFDPVTLHRFLLYLYTDDVGACHNWEDLCKLYSIADQYEVLSLSERCRSLLKCHFTIENTCEILTLADAHHDEDLIAGVKHFIAVHRRQILSSKEWGLFCSKNQCLAEQILTDSIYNGLKRKRD